jgi:PBSX family phage terminase large subunit
MQAVDACPDSQIWMLGHTSSTIYDNVIRLIREPPAPGSPDPLAVYRKLIFWKEGARKLIFRDKVIGTAGTKDRGAIGALQGKTISCLYFDEMTLADEDIIDWVDTRLSNPYSKAFGSMNPSHPSHKCKQWIDKAAEGNKDYYALQFMLEDNPYLDEAYKNLIKNSLSGVFFKRNYMGLWCLAEGAIFDFFDRAIHVKQKPPLCAEYWTVGIDDGTSNNFVALLIGVNTGKENQGQHVRWVEKEFVWDIEKRGRALTIAEKVEFVNELIEAYSVKGIYVDPAAAALKLEFRQKGIPVIDAKNDVYNGIQFMTSEMQQGRLIICAECKNTIKEIESYVWDPRYSEKGEDAPFKKDDHCVDALRYALYSHIPSSYDYEKDKKRQQEYWKNRYGK